MRIVDAPVVVLEAEPTSTVVTEDVGATKTAPRRKRPPRRRIVDLAQDDSPQRGVSEPTVVTRASFDSRRSTRKSLERTASIRSKEAAKSSRLEPPMLEDQDIEELPLEQQDEYRSKVEALRQQFGSNWLGALGEQKWHRDHHIEVRRGDTLAQPTNIHRSNSLNQAIVSGGRTLG